MRQILLEVRPNSAKNKIEKITDQVYKLWTSAPATEGKANLAVIKALSEHFKIAKSLITIKAGKSAKTKIIIIDD